MADVEYTVATQFQGDNELRQAANSFDGVSQSAKRALTAIESAGTHGKRSWTELKSQIDLIKDALGTVRDVAAGALSALSEGADLIAAREKFDNLAASINTTGDALLGSMREATKGMMTDAQLVASGTDLMSLGLAKTEGAVTRLASVIGTLGWDMQQVVLTMANNSTMRLDALGLSMEDVKRRTEALRDAGYSLDEAFDLAVLEAGEAKIALLGDTSETTAGKIQQLIVIMENAGDTAKTAFAEGMADSLSAALEASQELDAAIQSVATSWGQLGGGVGGTAVFQFAEDATRKKIQELGGDLEAIDAQIRKMQDWQLFELGFSPEDVERAAARYRILREELEKLLAIQQMINAPIDYPGPPQGVSKAAVDMAALAMATEDWGLVSEDVAERQAWLARAAQMVADAQRNAASADRERATELANVAAQLELAAVASQAWAEYTAAATARGGGIFSGFLDDIGAAREQGRAWGFDLMESIYQAMRDGGAGVNPLADFALQMGQSIDDIQAAVEGMQQQAIVEHLAGAAIAGKIAWEDYATAVQTAVDILKNGVPEQTAPPRVPVELELTETGDYQHLTSADFPPIAVKVTHNLDEIMAAVGEAQALVDGFANPSDVYQAVMDMDITAVEVGTAQATQLINGVPTEKTVTINFRQTGEDVLAALRALGVIP